MAVPGELGGSAGRNTFSTRPLPTPQRLPTVYAPAPVYTPPIEQSRQSALNYALNPFGGSSRPSMNANQIYTQPAKPAPKPATNNAYSAAVLQAAQQKEAQIAAQQAALAQAAAIVYGNGGGGGGGYGGGGGGGYSSGGYGGGYGGYTGGYSSGGGGSTVTVGGLPVGDVTSPVSGWAKRYLPAMIPDILANPGTIGRDTIKDMGVGGEALQGRYGELSTFIASQLLPIMYAGTPIGKIPKGGDVVNKLNALLSDMATPGGGEIDPRKLLDTVLSEGSKSTKDKQTLGSSLFAGMSPAKQGETMQGLVNNISNWLANPYFAQALRNWASTQKDEYISAASSAKNTYKDPFATYLKGTALPE